MADVRALLRQQRQLRRIDHPHAAYSDAGKLLCTLCREQIRAESQWESHTRSTAHKQRALASATRTAAEPSPSETAETATERGTGVAQTHDADAPEGPAEEEEREDDEDDKTLNATDGTETRTHAHKRKISDIEDGSDVAMDIDDAVRRKRNRGDISIDVSAANHRQGSAMDKDKDASTTNLPGRQEANRTPPTLARRMSSTPSRGVELQIPSRPATPAHRDSSSSTTPGVSALAGLTAAITHASSTAALAPNGSSSSSIATEKLSSGGGAQVDEDEWAAFEAEMAATAAPYADDAVISAPAMNAEESAAAAAALADGEGDGGGSRKSRADLDIEGEREDAARAREDEFDDMQQLEARVRRLKEKREELRRRASSVGQTNAPARLQSHLPDGDDKSPAAENGAEAIVEDEEGEDDDDDDDEEDDWDGFRFRK
ncbi:hypothetical protein CCM_01713 [Cordyceps militaris CM01]|uniref:Coiled-coil domain-containing protein 16 n=1 Tax=Cordyceps militaris (strain CM01) TaxID=983644 RepID=G3J6M6_CORMM|nr:uncharacterized protein CCM_01713 [Cordyceps militaris CM01]EGX97054.1 hypothetical protein CCM_01713 [Cordyceps militaris CM01]